MSAILNFFNFLINDVITQAPVFLGLVALLGLLLQKKDSASVVEGTIKTIVGVSILLAGVNLFVASLIPQIEIVKEQAGIVGVMPDNQSPFGVAILSFASEISLTFVLGFIIHLLLVRILPFKRTKNVFLTGHIMLFIGGFWVAMLAYNFNVAGTLLIVIASLLTGLTWTLFPAIARPFTKEMTDDEYTLGHMFNCAAVVGNYTGKLFKKSKKSEDIELPGVLAVFSDYTILLACMMPIVYIVMGIIAGREAIETLSGGQHWVIYQIMQGIAFSGSIMIVLYGVRTFLAAIIPAFEGISERLLPGAIPALDCPVFYPHAPVAAIFGFLGHGLGAILSTIILLSVNSPVVSIPSAIYIFFEGSLAGVFGDRFGGYKGAILSGLIIGLISHLTVVPLYYLQEPLGASGVIFGGTDFFIFTPIIYLAKMLFGA